MDLIEIENYILPWADEHMPEAAEKTRDMDWNETARAKFLARLITRRYERGDRGIPLKFLEESDLVLTMKHGDRQFEVRGRYAPGPRVISFKLLAIWYDTGVNIGNQLDAIEAFDLVEGVEIVKPEKKAPLPPPKEKPKRKEPSAVLELLPPEFRDRDA